jgi:hypothetical protein
MCPYDETMTLASKQAADMRAKGPASYPDRVDE